MLRGIAIYGCVPIGVVSGYVLCRRIDVYVNAEFKGKWDPLYYERTGSSPAIEAARSEILALTNRPDFIGLPESTQKAIMNSINQKYGI